MIAMTTEQVIGQQTGADEGHGFRKSETREAYYKAIERFLLQYVVFG